MIWQQPQRNENVVDSAPFAQHATRERSDKRCADPIMCGNGYSNGTLLIKSRGASDWVAIGSVCRWKAQGASAYRGLYSRLGEAR